ncbi:hypothetical protein Ddye_009940 [Dipteronia dyeriana]|uniref:DUF241 domain protein n=1 Tax=Dipteronia dyeriana TaxID=168575 RepID=A0AAD9XDD1_9ROSI|nr:hypothetical protein Ddye_009940 [Dipteronia dyeriana]
MAGKSGSQTMQVHSRSISLPARLNPNFVHIEAELNKFKTWELSSSSSSSASTVIPSGFKSIQAGLISLVELYNSIEEILIHSPATQQALHKHKHVKLVEAALDRSVGLLDACGNTRELISNMKDQLQELQSALRRRVGLGGDYSSMECKIHAYTSFRKKSKIDIAKCIRELKRMDSNIIESFNSIVDSDHEQMLMVNNVLRESSAITISIFRSILLFLSMPVMKTKPSSSSGWSLIRKLIPSASSDQQIFNEVGSVDIALCNLHRKIQKSDAKIDVQMAFRRLEILDATTKDLETRLDCLFRRLIQNRVTLLNIRTC